MSQYTGKASKKINKPNCSAKLVFFASFRTQFRNDKGVYSTNLMGKISGISE